MTRTFTATLTVTRTSTGTATSTPNPSGTSTGTITRTATTTRTPTLTATRTATPTGTPPATSTATSSPSPSQTATRTLTPTRTLTSTATRTLTVTPTRTSSATRTATVTRTPSSTRTRTLTPTATPTPLPGGPEITFFGIAEASGVVQTPTSKDAFERKVYRRPLGSNFLIVIEARPGGNNTLVGTSLPTEDDGVSLPDVLIQSNRSLGNGSPDVCDIGPPPDIGGVPGFNPPVLSTDSAPVRRAFIDFACRFRLHARSDEACTVNSLLNFRFASPLITGQTVQFCFEPAVGTEVAFKSGPTVLNVRVRDRNGGIGDPVEIVVEVE